MHNEVERTNPTGATTTNREERLLECDELATYLHVHPQTVRNMAHAKIIQFVKIGREFRFNLEQVLEALANRHDV